MNFFQAKIWFVESNRWATGHDFDWMTGVDFHTTTSGSLDSSFKLGLKAAGNILRLWQKAGLGNPKMELVIFKSLDKSFKSWQEHMRQDIEWSRLHISVPFVCTK
jgi:hypothetical protein